MIGNIRIVHVSPEANGAGEFLPHAFVFPDTLFTVLDERLQTILLDLLLAIQAKHLLYFQLNRKSVGIPACLTRNHAAFHGAVTRDHIFDNTGQYVADMRLAVCGRRAIVEGVGRTLFAGIHTLLENVLIIPELFNFFLSLYKIHICRYFLIHAFLCLQSLTHAAGILCNVS